MISVLIIAATLTSCVAGPDTNDEASTKSVAAIAPPRPATTPPRQESDAATDPGDLYTYNMMSRKITRLTDDPGVDGAPASMPDGQHLLFGRLVSGSDPESGNSEILLIAPDGSNEQQLTDHPAADVTTRPSPDG